VGHIFHLLINYPPFTEPECSLPYSQESTGLHSELRQTKSPPQPISLRTITILLPPTLSSPKWSFRFKFTYRNPVRISHLSQICNVQSPDFHHRNTYAVGTNVRSDQRRCSNAEGLLGLRPILNMKNEIFLVVGILIVLSWATIPYRMIAIYQHFQRKILPLPSEQK